MNDSDKKLIADAARMLGSDLIKANANILDHGIRAGNVNGAQGLLFGMAYFDLLHGGAYRWDYGPEKLPFWSKGIKDELAFSDGPIGSIFKILQVPHTITIPEGYPGAGKQLTFGAGATTQEAEVMIDAFVPRVLPKLLSDQAYYLIYERTGQLLNTILLQGIGTGLKTFVDSGVEILGAVKGFTPETETSEERVELAKLSKAALARADTAATVLGD